MKKKIALIPIVACLLCPYIFNNNDDLNYKEYTFASEPTASIVIEEPLVDPLPYTEEEINLIALVTMAEAEGECEEGQRLVIDTILNRVESTYFPNTVNGVIYQKNQFTCMWNGRINRCYVRDDIKQLVYEEIKTRTNTEVVFFNSVGYTRYGQALFKVGNHYFSKYKY